MGVNLSIKGVPDDIAERLRELAMRNHRSLQGELMAIIERAANAEHAAPELAPAGRVVAERRGWKTIDDLIVERRSRASRHLVGVPLAVDIVRADRDRR